MQKIIVLLLLFPSMAFAQKTNSPIKAVINNTKTAAHINIPGTRLYIIPPKNFTVAKNFIGLEKGDRAIINVYDVKGSNFYIGTQTFTAKEFEKKGAKVFDYRTLKFNGYDAKYIYMNGQPMQKGYGLVFGDTTFSVMLMALFADTDDETARDVINAFATVWYDKHKKIDPFATANFTVSDSVSKFKFHEYNANLYTYTLDGVDITGDENAPLLMITQFPKETPVTAKDQAYIFLNKAVEYGLTVRDIKSEITSKINGNDAYQVDVYGTLKGKNCAFYFCAITKDDKAVVIEGIAKNDLESNLIEFKKIAANVKLKL